MKRPFWRRKIPLLAVGLMIHLFWYGILMLAAEHGRIGLGILAICGYRATLWYSPLVTLLIMSFPIREDILFRKRVIYTLSALAANGLLFVLCYVSFGAWF